jgi:hypothetical protein
MSNYDGWAIVTPWWKDVMIWSIKGTRSECIRMLYRNYRGDEETDSINNWWRGRKRQGYRCVKVRVEEVE